MSKTFERAMADLEKLVAEMESGNLGLEESIDKFEEGMKMINECRKSLECAKGRIEKILENGEITSFGGETNE